MAAEVAAAAAEVECQLKATRNVVHAVADVPGNLVAHLLVLADARQERAPVPLAPLRLAVKDTGLLLLRRGSRAQPEPPCQPSSALTSGKHSSTDCLVVPTGLGERE